MPRKPKDENDQLAKAVGERLQAAMDRLGLKLTELHKRTGISRTVLLAYVRGTYAPGARELKLLCEHLEVTPTVILFGSNDLKQAPYRIGDLQITSDGARLVTMLHLIASLTQPEQEAILSLAESILRGRNPEGLAGMVKALDVMLASEAGHQLTAGLAGMVDTLFAENSETVDALMEQANK